MKWYENIGLAPLRLSFDISDVLLISGAIVLVLMILFSLGILIKLHFDYSKKIREWLNHSVLVGMIGGIISGFGLLALQILQWF